MKNIQKSHSHMKITIFWTGYVGLVSGACLAEIGHAVLCVDVDEQKIKNLQNGIMPIYEPGLRELVSSNTQEKRLFFTTDAKEWVDFWDIVLCAVGTPQTDGQRADLQYVQQVLESFATHMTGYKLFVNKSTVPVGTGSWAKQTIANILKKRGEDLDFDIVSNPEFLREGNALTDFLEPDRIVIGTESEKAKKLMTEVYEHFGEEKMIHTNIKSAEIIKYASNSFLATKISFINEMANFCELTGGDIVDVARGMGADPRIGASFLSAGIWYGGICFPKDVNAMIATGIDIGYQFRIIPATVEVNNTQKRKPIQKLSKYFPSFEGKKVAIWWLAFKPNTDDTREAPSLVVTRLLLERGVSQIIAYDPMARENFQTWFLHEERIQYVHEKYEALKEADALLVLTEWNEFLEVDFENIRSLLNYPLIIDGRNMWRAKNLSEMWFIYEGIG